MTQASLLALWWRVYLKSRRPGFDPWVGKIPSRRKWQPTPLFLPGEFHEQGSLVGYSPWGSKELDTMEWLTLSLMAQIVKNLPAVLKTGIQSLGQEDNLEKGMETHSSILAWRIPWTEEPGGQQSMGSQRVGHDRVTKTHRLKDIRF